MSGKKILLIMLLLLLVACGPAEAENNVSAPTAAADTVADEAETEHEEDSEHDDDHDHEEDEHDSAEHDEDEHREHEAHEHGVAAMTVAWSGQELLIDLETPGFNVLGFEYAPASDAEKAEFAESVALLESGDFLAFNAEAACTLLSAEVDSVYAEGAEHEAEAEHEDEAETHSDIDVAYSVRCENPAELTELDLNGLFTQFPNFAELRVQWVSDTAQSAQELTPAAAVLELR